MNYIKIFRGTDEEVEARVNAFLKDAAEKDHRLNSFNVRVHDNGQTYAVLQLKDDPHPKRK